MEDTQCRLTQRDRVARFRALHEHPDILLLPNAWDVASALVLESAGFEALATTSAGIAASLGFPDGEMMGLDAHLGVVRRMASAIRAPLSADLEGGYGSDAVSIGASVTAAIKAGVVGVNLEDGLASRDRLIRGESEHAEAIRAARRAATDAGADLFINARTDVYWLQIGNERDRRNSTIRRALAYCEAGADGIFVPGAASDDEIAILAREIPRPLNVLAMPGMSSPPRLAEIGVRRVSVGSGLARVALGSLRAAADHLKLGTPYEVVFRNAIPYADLQRRLASTDIEHQNRDRHRAVYGDDC